MKEVATRLRFPSLQMSFAHPQSPKPNYRTLSY